MRRHLVNGLDTKDTYDEAPRKRPGREGGAR
jgi:hypothetical protein